MRITRQRRAGWAVVPIIGLLMLMPSVTKGADEPKGEKGPATPMTTQAGRVPSADECLACEIKKSKALKGLVTGDPEEKKQALEEIDEAITYMESFVGKPMPPYGPSIGSSAQRALGDQINRLLDDREKNGMTIRAEKRPLADVLRQIQDQAYDSLRIFIWNALDGKFDPRPDIVEEYAHAMPSIDWKTLQLAGVGPETPVTVEIHGASPLAAVFQTLKSVKAADLVLEPENTGGGGLFPAQPSDRFAVLATLAYNVRDLLAPVNSKRAGGRVGGATAADLMNAIMATTGPGLWGGGNGMTMVDFKGIVTITATAEMHANVAAFLDRLRKMDHEDELPLAAATQGSNQETTSTQKAAEKETHDEK